APFQRAERITYGNRNPAAAAPSARAWTAVAKRSDDTAFANPARSTPLHAPPHTWLSVFPLQRIRTRHKLLPIVPCDPFILPALPLPPPLNLHPTNATNTNAAIKISGIKATMSGRTLESARQM